MTHTERERERVCVCACIKLERERERELTRVAILFKRSMARVREDLLNGKAQYG